LEKLASYPYLQLDPLVVSEDSLHFEVNSHGGDKRRREGIICVAKEKRCLSHTRVADDEKFEHVVEVLVCGIFLPFGILSSHLKYSRIVYEKMRFM
jgi:hypothetical protein